MSIDADKTAYVIDTNILIGFSIWNPLEFKSGFWNQFEKALEDKRWVLLDVVVDEVKYDSELKKWCKKQKDNGLVTTIDSEVRDLATDINNKYKMINPETGNSGVDPFIVAFASKNGFGVCTREIYKINGESLYKIPDVCDILKILCIKSPKQFMKSIGFV